MKNVLIIVESPSKIKTIKKILGDDYNVAASYGHIRDLDNDCHGLGIDVANDYEPHYCIIGLESDKKRKASTKKQYANMKTKEEVVKELKRLAKDADVVMLASDPDREGEAIAWHLKEVLNHKNVKRITFNEITKTAVVRAIENPRDIDMDLFYSQQARRILDRLVGFTLSPVLWKKIAKGLSVGRVQSPALMLVADKEKEIRIFVSEEYFDVFAHVITHKKDNYTLKLEKIKREKTRIKSENDALDICNAIEKNWDSGTVNVSEQKSKRTPNPPYITSTLQKAGVNILGWTAEFTMQSAQRLYEAGHITYMRTDSVRLSDDAMNAIESYIKNEYGKDYYKRRVYTAKQAAQDAHEAIRPSHIDIKEVNGEDQRLYDLIWRAAVSSQMADAILDETEVIAKVKDYELKAKGFKIAYDGFMKVMPMEIKDPLPEVKSGIENNKLKTTEKEKKQTKAPSRYSEARLIEVLEKEGVGRPSTYASIMETLLKRKYVERKGKGKGAVLQATDLGIQVSDYLKENFSNFISLKFTAEMETDLDNVMSGDNKWTNAVHKYYPSLKLEADKIGKSQDTTGEVCPECGKNLVYRVGKNGRFEGCSGYPKCKYIKKDGQQSAKTTGEACPECGTGELVEKTGKYGKFVGCNRYPECKYIKKETKVCPKCGGNLVKKFSQKTKKSFWGCENYPECK